MAEPFRALSTKPDDTADDADFDAIHRALSATERGRWFLQAYSSRTGAGSTRGDVAASPDSPLSPGGFDVASPPAVRDELIEMARSIADAQRAARIDAQPRSSASPEQSVVVAANRFLRIAAALRECNVEVATGEQVEAIAHAILTAVAAGRAEGARAHQLAEALHYLEHRIERMLDDATEPGSSQPAALDIEPAQDRAEPALPASDVAAEDDAQTALDHPPLAELTPPAAATVAERSDTAPTAAPRDSGRDDQPRGYASSSDSPADFLLEPFSGLETAVADALAASHAETKSDGDDLFEPSWPDEPAGANSTAGSASAVPASHAASSRTSDDAFAKVKALTDSERIALFS